MRLLFIVHQFFPEFASGTERVTLQLARAAQRAGHPVQVLGCEVHAGACGWPAEPGLAGARCGVVDGVPVVALERASLPAWADSRLDTDPQRVTEIAGWMQARRFDLVHVMHTMRMGSAVAAAQRLGLPLVLTLTDFFLACHRVNLVDLAGHACPGPDGGRECTRRCQDLAWAEGAAEARHWQASALLGAAAARVVPSRFVAERLRAAFAGLDFRVLGHGTDLLALARAARQGAGAGAEDAGTDRGARLSLAFLGTLIRPKGLDLLLRALALRRELPVQLRVAGLAGADAQYEAELRRFADADPRVELLGECSRSQVAALIRGTDLLCLPSLLPETFSLAVHECAALGVPSLVADRGAPADLIRATGGGGIVDGDTPEAWSSSLSIWAGDAALRQRWRQAVAMPPRVEEEAALYENLYRAALRRDQVEGGG